MAVNAEGAFDPRGLVNVLKELGADVLALQDVFMAAPTTGEEGIGFDLMELFLANCVF